MQTSLLPPPMQRLRERLIEVSVVYAIDREAFGGPMPLKPPSQDFAARGYQSVPIYGMMVPRGDSSRKRFLSPGCFQSVEGREMMRTGAQALGVLAAPLNVHILKALEDGPKGLLDLHREVGGPPQSTMRVYTRTLEELGVLERRRQNEFPATAEYSLTPAGESLLKVAALLQEWLLAAPDGPILLGSMAAKSSIKALAGGWSFNIVRALAARPLSLTELNVLISKVSYPTLERKLSTMRSSKLVEPQPGEGRGTPCGPTNWLRQAVIPLTSAAAWERKFAPETTPPIGRRAVG
jgi:DNA-binding HxlR family transcriptional regulator